MKIALLLVAVAANGAAAAPTHTCNYTYYENKIVNMSKDLDNFATQIELLYNKTGRTDDTATDALSNINKVMREFYNTTDRDQATLEKYVDKVEGLEATLNVQATICGAMFLILAKLGFLSRHMGMVTTKNVKLTIVSDLFVTSAAVLGWVLLGWNFAFGPDLGGEEHGFIGEFADPFAEQQYDLTMTNAVKWSQNILQMCFCIVAATIPSGCLAERTQLLTTIIYGFLTSALIYPVIAHTVWADLDLFDGAGSGWLSSYRGSELLFDCGTVDHAGAAVVHMTGGVIGLAGIVILGARHRRFEEEAKAILIRPKPQASPVFEAFGTVILLFSFTAVAGFCNRDFVGAGLLSAVAMSNVLVSAGAACITAVLLGKFFTSVAAPALASGGLMAGVVAISSGCAVMNVDGAIYTGFIAGWAYYIGGMLCLKLRYDDVSHGVAIHFFSAVWGCLATGLFATEAGYQRAYPADRLAECYGVFYGADVNLLLAQVFLCMFVIMWAGLISTVVFGLLYLGGVGRYSQNMEVDGIDYHQFGGKTQFVPLTKDADLFRVAHGILTDTDYGTDIKGTTRTL